MYKNISIVVLAFLVIILGAHSWQLRQNDKAMQEAIDAQKTELETLKTRLNPVIQFSEQMEARRRNSSGGPDRFQPPTDANGNPLPPPGMNGQDGQEGRHMRNQNGQRQFRRPGRGTAAADNAAAPAPGEPAPAGEPEAEPIQ
ncbi:MAG: hypothetical protein AB7F40_00450 [Victivallaceae bacterium]|nr:hypothetical protein [Victivallaceae bacterium]